MKLAWCTDIHLNFLEPGARAAFAATLGRSKPDAVLVGGDITVAPKLEEHLRELERALSCPIHFVLGNHDFWGSSVAKVRAAMTALTKASPRLRWLPAEGIVKLTEKTALVGHDAWADARLGDWEGSKIFMNDFARIEDFAYMGKPQRRAKVQAFGDEAGGYLRDVLPRALERFSRVLVLVHVPPFREAAWHEGQISGDDWLPHMTCKAAGDAILEAARARPDRELLVLCGHTHGSGEARLLPNLTVRTGGAEYGEPEVQPLIDVD